MMKLTILRKRRSLDMAYTSLTVSCRLNQPLPTSLSETRIADLSVEVQLDLRFVTASSSAVAWVAENSSSETDLVMVVAKSDIPSSLLHSSRIFCVQMMISGFERSVWKAKPLRASLES